MTRAPWRRLPRPPLAVSLALVAATAFAAPQRGADVVAPARIASHMALCAHLDQYPGYSDIWGYTAPNGKEYALLGTTDGVSVVNVTDPYHPYETGFINGPHSNWRELKVYMNYMYVVNENGGGLQIVSLYDPESPRPIQSYLGFNTAHDVTVEFENHMLYVCGSNVGNGGVMMLRLNNPIVPELYRTWDVQYAHDVHVRGDWMYVSAIRVASLYIVDISERRPMSVKGVISGYQFAFTHNAWTTEDGNHLLTTDEMSGASTRVWDITDPAHWQANGSYKPPEVPVAIPHNVFVDDHDLAYISHYTAGVRVVDVSDPNDPVEVAFFDTVAQHDGPVFDGCWGVFPFFPNSPELVVASDISTGLYVLRVADSVIDRSSRAELVSSIRASRAAAATQGGAAHVDGLAALRVSSPAPNPLVAGASTRFDLSLTAPAAVRVDVVDAGGRLVRQLVNGPRANGTTSITWDGRDAVGMGAASGVYFLRVSDGERTESRRVVVQR